MVFFPLFYGPNHPGPCSDRVNFPHEWNCTHDVPPYVNMPLNPPPERPPRFYRRTPCANNATRHGPGYAVCGQCVEIAEDRQWYKMAVSRMTKPPPAPEKETNKWLGFWTRMCYSCEKGEQYLIAERQRSLLLLAPALPPNVHHMADYPTNTCTCRGHWISKGFAQTIGGITGIISDQI